MSDDLSIVEDVAVDELLMLSFEVSEHEPRFFSKNTFKFNEDHQMPLKKMMLASAAHPSYFSEAGFEGYGTFVSGDSVAISPYLFSFHFAVENRKKDPKELRIVNIGSTHVVHDAVPGGRDEQKEYMNNFIKQQKSMNHISAFHWERPIRQKFRDHMLHLIMDKNENDELYTYRLLVKPEEERHLYELSSKNEELQQLSKKMIETSTDGEKGMKAMLKKILSEKFEDC